MRGLRRYGHLFANGRCRPFGAKDRYRPDLVNSHATYVRRLNRYQALGSQSHRPDLVNSYAPRTTWTSCLPSQSRNPTVLIWSIPTGANFDVVLEVKLSQSHHPDLVSSNRTNASTPS